jgi:hypothetical protein
MEAMDSGYTAFLSTVIFHHKYRNPVFSTFAYLFDRHKKKGQEQQGNGGGGGATEEWAADGTQDTKTYKTRSVCLSICRSVQQPSSDSLVFVHVSMYRNVLPAAHIRIKQTKTLYHEYIDIFTFSYSGSASCSHEVLVDLASCFMPPKLEGNLPIPCQIHLYVHEYTRAFTFRKHWLIAYTLARNPSIAKYRAIEAHEAPAPKEYVESGYKQRDAIALDIGKKETIEEYQVCI